MKKLPASPAAAQRGFTLVEVMVSVALLALVVGVVSVSIWYDSVSSKLDRVGRQLKSTIEFVAEEALMQGTHYGLSLLRGRDFGRAYNGWYYQWYQQREDGNWWPLSQRDDEIFAATELPGELIVALSREGQPLAMDADAVQGEEYQLPQLFFFSSGEITPFSLQIEHRDSDYILQLDADMLGRVMIKDSGDDA